MDKKIEPPEGGSITLSNVVTLLNVICALTQIVCAKAQEGIVYGCFIDTYMRTELIQCGVAKRPETFEAKLAHMSELEHIGGDV